MALILGAERREAERFNPSATIYAACGGASSLCVSASDSLRLETHLHLRFECFDRSSTLFMTSEWQAARFLSDDRCCCAIFTTVGMGG